MLGQGEGMNLVPAQHTLTMSQQQHPFLTAADNANARRKETGVWSFIEEDIDDSTSTTEVINSQTETTRPERIQQQQQHQESRSRSQIHTTVQWQSK